MLKTKELREFYKTSPMREGVLCWYPFPLGASVVDLSGGALGELFERLGLRVLTSVEAAGGADYVVVLDPPAFGVEALSGYKKMLNAHGRLLIAYENPFALRYWAGKGAFDSGLPFDTLFGRGENPLPSRAEMSGRLKRAGFGGQKWYYPLTDHWFAREIYSEGYLPNEFINQRFVPYLEDDLSLRFDERGLYREVVRGGAFEFMCGAYLAEARVCETDAACAVDYAAVTAYRETQKRFATIVRNDDTVHKKPLHKDGEESVKRICESHKELKALGVNVVDCEVKDGSLVMPRVNLPTLGDYWAEKATEGTLCEREIYGQFDRIRDSIYKAAESGKCYWELVPDNCFYDEKADEIIFFDQEFYWCADADIALARAVGFLLWSPVLAKDARASRWFSELKSRYGLEERWGELEKTAGEGTCVQVFNPQATRVIEDVTQRAAAHIAERANESFAEARRYGLMGEAGGKLKDAGYRRPAVYGYGVRGKTLKRALEDYGFDVAFVYDKKFAAEKSLGEMAEECSPDVIVVSIGKGEDIADELRDTVSVPVFMVEEFLRG